MNWFDWLIDYYYFFIIIIFFIEICQWNAVYSFVILVQMWCDWDYYKSVTRVLPQVCYNLPQPGVGCNMLGDLI